MKILVIDDQPCNTQSAHTTLGGDHEVTTVVSIDEAYEMFERPIGLHQNGDAKAAEYDAILTDLWMPKGDFQGDMGPNEIATTSWDKQLPAGLVFALKAQNLGIPTVICTDSDHHADWICTMLDLVGGALYRPDPEQRVAYVEARTCCMEVDEQGRITKDWRKAMQDSGLFQK